MPGIGSLITDLPKRFMVPLTGRFLSTYGQFRRVTQFPIVTGMPETLLFLSELVSVQADRQKRDALLTKIFSLLAERQDAINAKIKPESERECKQASVKFKKSPL